METPAGLAGGRVPAILDIRAAFMQIFDRSLPDADRLPAIEQAFFARGRSVPEHWIDGWYRAAMLAQAAALDETPVESGWSGGRAPILVIQPGEDGLAPLANAALLRDEFPDRVRVVEIPRAGHALLPEQPQAVATAVLDFLASQQASRP